MRSFSASDRDVIASLRGATVVLDDRAVLRRASLEIIPGITVLRGANGAGKTTLLRALAGLVPLARGERDVPQDVLYLGHRPQLLHGLTARENLRFLSDLRGTSGDVPLALARWGLAGDADRAVERLSAGQRRRAALARLATERCELVLLDEPFAELDADAAGLLRTSLTDETAPPAILIASHGHAELDDLAVRVYEVADASVSLVRGR